MKIQEKNLEIELTEIQENALIFLYQSPVSDWELILISRSKRTMYSLEKKGLAKWHPYAKWPTRREYKGCWKITAAGRKYVKKHLTVDSD